MEQTNKKPSLIKLFLYFLKIGLFTIGGGYAMIGMLEKEIVEKNHWITHDDMLNIIVIGESTPGPIAVNLATFIGYKMHGFWGSFLCTLGFVLPSFAIITIISVCMQYIKNVPLWVEWFFKGLRAGVVMLIGSACLKFFKRMDKTFFAFLMLFMGFFVSFFTDLSVIYLILIGGVLGLLYSYAVTKISKNKNKKTAENSEFTGRNDKNTEKPIKNKVVIKDNIIEVTCENIPEKLGENENLSIKQDESEKEVERQENLPINNAENIMSESQNNASEKMQNKEDKL